MRTIKKRNGQDWTTTNNLHSNMQSEASAQFENDDHQIIKTKSKPKEKVECKECKHYKYDRERMNCFRPYKCEFEHKYNPSNRKIICKKFEKK